MAESRQPSRISTVRRRVPSYVIPIRLSTAADAPLRGSQVASTRSSPRTSKPIAHSSRAISPSDALAPELVVHGVADLAAPPAGVADVQLTDSEHAELRVGRHPRVPQLRLAPPGRDRRGGERLGLLLAVRTPGLVAGGNGLRSPIVDPRPVAELHRPQSDLRQVKFAHLQQVNPADVDQSRVWCSKSSSSPSSSSSITVQSRSRAVSDSM